MTPSGVAVGNDHIYGGTGDDMLDVRPDALIPGDLERVGARPTSRATTASTSPTAATTRTPCRATWPTTGPSTATGCSTGSACTTSRTCARRAYGAYVTIRDQNPALIDYLLEQAATDGALTPDVKTSSGGNEIAMVYKPDVKNNANPVYPGTPGHFFCF